MIGSNMFSSWEPFALILHFTGPENNFTLLCNFIYIINKTNKKTWFYIKCYYFCDLLTNGKILVELCCCCKSWK